MPATAIYAAEDIWSTMLDRGGLVDFFGSLIDIPVQRRFADIPSIQAYVDEVLSFTAVQDAYPAAGPVTVRERRGQTKAHYEPMGATIAIPMVNRAYGRESVVLHELAHHLSVSAGVPIGPSGHRWHGKEFQQAMLTLAAAVLGEPAALLLRAGYHNM